MASNEGETREARIPLRNDPRLKLLPKPRHRQGPDHAATRLHRSIVRAVHALLYFVLHLFFSLYIRTRKSYHVIVYAAASVLFYHHRTPQLIQRDTSGLRKRPKHLSVILTAESESRAGGELERLVDEAAEVAVWTACAGIPQLSIYEKTGILKRYLPQVHRNIVKKFIVYFGRNHPVLTVAAPHQEKLQSEGSARAPYQDHLEIIFISAQDGRESMVDLTKTLADMSQRGKLSASDVQTDLIDTELSEGIFPEPDLLILFGPHIELSAYPPWQLRLTEIFCLQDNEGVGYQVFLKALRNYSKAEFRQGK